MIGEICKNCKSEAMQNYCPNCGTPVALKRINGQYILKEISSVLNFDKGILYPRSVKSPDFEANKKIRLDYKKNMKNYIDDGIIKTTTQS